MITDRAVAAHVPDTLLTRKEVAALARVRPHTVYRWDRAGFGPPCIKIGRHYRYRSSGVLAWLAAREVQPNVVQDAA